jgi:hypothetical protein
MNHRTRRSVASLVLSSLLLASAFAAADPPPNGGPPGRRGPPQAAFDACANQTEGAVCTVQLPDRTLQGTCATFPERGLACRPAGMPPGGGPPPR